MYHFIKKITFVLVGYILLATPVMAAESLYPPKQSWSWTGYLGAYDKASAQRGLQVFTEVCYTCHGLQYIRFRNLAALGYDEKQLKNFAKQFEVINGIDEEGTVTKKPGILANSFPDPFYSEQHARDSNGGAYPPDLSLIVDANANGRGNFFLNLMDAVTAQGNASGADYLYALLTGYDDAPSDMNMLEGMHYNTWYAGHQIAMPQPLYEDSVEYADSTPASVEQMAHDVTTFLAWASEPSLEERRSLGLIVLILMALFVVLLYVIKKRTWRNVH